MVAFPSQLPPQAWGCFIKNHPTDLGQEHKVTLTKLPHEGFHNCSHPFLPVELLVFEASVEGGRVPGSSHPRERVKG